MNYDIETVLGTRKLDLIPNFLIPPCPDLFGN
jgi:hypothetical protein